MIGILGSGFGLYGYLPAVCQIGSKVALLSKSKQKFYSRLELAQYTNQIIWFESETDLFSNVKTLIIALPPFMQGKYFELAIQYKNIENYIFEKPLEKNPQEAMRLLSVIIAARVNFRIGYTFCYSPWGKELLNYIESNGCESFRLNWVIKKRKEFVSDLNWKENKVAGGGLLRFYGIHALALAVFSVLEVDHSFFIKIAKSLSGQIFGTEIVFKRQKVKINLKFSETEEHFEVEVQGKNRQKYFYENSGPFGVIHHDREDVRVPILKTMLEDLAIQKLSKDLEKKYVMCNRLWQNIEYQQMKFIRNE